MQQLLKKSGKIVTYNYIKDLFRLTNKNKMSIWVKENAIIISNIIDESTISAMKHEGFIYKAKTRQCFLFMRDIKNN